ncbi:probable serine/threonine-protein kinase PBL1 [Cornus florida]|uniref:probable serine/threonine-protein kinase PBL1 n=1 Tax=Cornus florida TaxID=4283 RepID=UPI00289D16C1|nr:probable serine/threonine-protein kinase PBL1 [Cornus florida]
MGCFTVLKSKKKKSEQANYIKPVNHHEHTSATLPEPKHTRTLHSAPPSFIIRERSVQPINSVKNRMRLLSAPSSFNSPGQDDLLSVECEEQEESKGRVGSMKEHRTPSPQPLPLPSPQSAAVLKPMGSFNLGNANGPLKAYGPQPLPSLGAHRNFSCEEITTACHNFSPKQCVSEGHYSAMYRASFGDDASGSKRLEATVTRLQPSTQGLREFINEVNTLASLQNPYLCKLLGFHACEGSKQRMLAYERLFHGSLDQLLCGSSDGPFIDWNARMKVALCAAQGLTFLHEEGPFQVMFSDFSTANIQIDRDFSAKLSGYGCINHIPETEISNSLALENQSLETLGRGLLTPKSNVWSFGIVLLELLTGRKNLDSHHPKEERNLVKWSRPFLADDCRLWLIMDPQLKGRIPPKAARTVADIAQRCLQQDPSERPTMRNVVKHLKTIQDMKYSCLFPLQEPGAVARKYMSRSPSLNGVVGTLESRSSFSPPTPATRRLIYPSRPLARPLSLPPQTCSSALSLVEMDRQKIRKSSLSTVQRATIEGF